MMSEANETAESAPAVKRKRTAKPRKAQPATGQKTVVAAVTTGAIALVEWWLAARFGIKLF